MSRAAAVVAVVLALLVGDRAAGQDAVASSTDAQVREALADYPWYDARTDSAERLWSAREIGEPEVDLGFWGRVLQVLGGVLVYGFFVVLLVALLVFVARYLSRLEIPDDEPTRRGPARKVSREGALPPGMEADVADPWAAAAEARRRGDLSRAVVLLFAHELLVLERHGRVRLVPGRTGRQLVRSIGEAEVRRLVEPTLRLFEAVYYGHRAPDPSRVDAAWTDAEALDRLLAQGRTS